jgi:hypothetical protein
MPRLNDFTDIILSGIRGGALSNWTKFSLGTSVGNDTWKAFKSASSPLYFDPTGYNSTYDGTNHLVLTGTNSGNTVKFYSLRINDITTGTLGEPTSSVSDASIKRVLSFSGVSTTANPKFYFGCARSLDTTNNSFSYSGSGTWPTVGIYSGAAGSETINVINDIQDSGTGDYYKLALTGESSLGYDNGNTVLSNDNDTILIASVMPIGSTSSYGIMVSTNGGTTWAISDAPTTYWYRDLVYARDAFYTFYYDSGNSRFVFLKSTNGSNWTEISTTSFNNTVNYNRLHYVGGKFVLLHSNSQRYRLSHNLSTWNDAIYVPNGAEGVSGDLLEFSSFEGKAISVMPTVGQISYTQHFRGALSGKTGHDRGWRVDSKDKRKSAASGFMQFLYHAEKIDGTYNRGWYLFDVPTGGGELVCYVNTNIADLPSLLDESPQLYSAWKPVSQFNGNAIFNVNVYSRQNPYSKETLAVTTDYGLDWSSSYKNWCSSDMLNWTEASSIEYTVGFSLFEPNQTDASWLVGVRNFPGTIRVSSTGPTGTWTTANIPAGLRVSTNGFYGHAVGVGSNWLVSCVQATSGSQWKIIYSTDGGANFSELSGTPSNTSRPFSVGYANGYWFYWVSNGSATGFYYSSDMVNWTYNSGSMTGGYSQREIKYINGRYTFISGASLTSHTDITATTGWLSCNLGVFGMSFYPAYDNDYFVGLNDIFNNKSRRTYINVSVSNASSWNGLITSITESTDATNDVIETQGTLWGNGSLEDDGLDNYARPFYYNGYWHVIGYSGTVYRIAHNRLAA